MFAEFSKNEATEYLVNSAFNKALLNFKDGSQLVFEHTSRENRWARASAERTTADMICKSLRNFRLNAKHLQLYFEDGTDTEFFTLERNETSDGNPAP